MQARTLIDKLTANFSYSKAETARDNVVEAVACKLGDSVLEAKALLTRLVDKLNKRKTELLAKD